MNGQPNADQERSLWQVRTSASKSVACGYFSTATPFRRQSVCTALDLIRDTEISKYPTSTAHETMQDQQRTLIKGFFWGGVVMLNADKGE